MSDRIFVKIILSVNICSPCINFNLRNPIHTNQQARVDLRQSCGFNSFGITLPQISSTTLHFLHFFAQLTLPHLLGAKFITPLSSWAADGQKKIKTLRCSRTDVAGVED